jgi:hypothetical protein
VFDAAAVRRPYRKIRALATYAAIVAVVVVMLTLRHAARGFSRPLETTILGIHGEGVVGLIGMLIGGLLAWLSVTPRHQDRR